MEEKISKIEKSEIEQMEEAQFLNDMDKVDYPAFNQGLNEYASLFSNYGIDLIDAIENLRGLNPVIVDLGAGDGTAISQIKELIGECECYAVVPKIPENFQIDGINIIEGNANNLENLLKNIDTKERPVIVISVYLARYLIDPFKFLKSVYNFLKPSDLAFIYELPIPLVRANLTPDEDSINRLIQYLNLFNIQILHKKGVFNNAAIVKKENETDLVIPVELKGILKEANRAVFTLNNE